MLSINISRIMSTVVIAVTFAVLGIGQTRARDVLTYHYDVGRTGWDDQENTLTPVNVKPGSFGRVATALLDDANDQVDAQPLVVTNLAIQGKGTHAVVYIATENNSVYALDAFTGARLLKVNLGAPVPRPLNCENNGPAVGINSTPTIDRKSGTLYVMAYVLRGTSPVHQLHALDLATLKDQRPPVTVSAASNLANGKSFAFDSSVQRQRSALLEANGNIYAGFGSYCDFKASQSRGWVLGWQTSNLAPLSKHKLLSTTTATSTFNCYFHAPWPNNHPCYLASVWMSGYGVAADPQGDLLFTTGNTGRGFYNKNTDLAESMVKLSPDLGIVLDYFTPSDANTLDSQDLDFGSGGTLVVPDQVGTAVHLAVAAGKDGNMYVINRDTGKMGEFRNPNVPKSVYIGGDCHCGPSYFMGSDGQPRIVSSGGTQLMQWKLTPTLANPSQPPGLEARSSISSGQDGGFFTSISSNGTTANSAIIWAVGRPVSNSNTNVTLVAYDATASGGALRTLWSGPSGSWPNTGGNANIVPTVANGLVYVASYKQVQVFGLVRPSPTALIVAATQGAAPETQYPTTGPLYWGTIRAVSGSRITLELRTGETLTVDVSKIMPTATADFAAIGRWLAVAGTMGPNGVFEASGLWRVKGPAFFGTDRDR